MPKVSVITIFYNAEKYFSEAIESVLNQTYDNWELILADDGSTDNSTAIAQQYAKRYADRIRYVEHEGHRNRGMSATRNLGLRHAQGEYIALLDADDVWLPEKLERQVKILDENPTAAMIYGPTLYWYEWDSNPQNKKRDQLGRIGVVPNAIYPSPALMTLYLTDSGYVPCTCGLMVRKKALESIGGFEENFKSIYEDQVFFSKMALNYSIYVSDGSWDKYRQHKDSACHQEEKKGNYNSAGRPNRAEKAYLKWLAQYVSQNKFNDPDLKRILRQRVSIYDDRLQQLIHQKIQPVWQRVRSKFGKYRALSLSTQESTAPIKQKDDYVMINLDQTYVNYIDGGYELKDIWKAPHYYHPEVLFKNTMYIAFLEKFKNNTQVADDEIKETHYYQSSLNTLKTYGICRQHKTEADLLGQCRYFLNLYRAFKNGTYLKDYQKFATSEAHSRHPDASVSKLEGTNYYMITDGHHRLACLYVLGVRLVKVRLTGVLDVNNELSAKS